jgi:hypothetical protein
LQDRTLPLGTRLLALDALTTIAQTHDTETLTIVQRLTERQVDPQEDPLVQRQAALALKQIDRPAPLTLSAALATWLTKNPAITTGLGSLAGVALLYLGILWLKPLWLLGLPGTLTIPNTQIELPSGWLLWLKYRPQVLGPLGGGSPGTSQNEIFDP